MTESFIYGWKYAKGVYAGMAIYSISFGITRLLLPDIVVPSYGFILMGIFFIIMSYFITKEDVE